MRKTLLVILSTILVLLTPVISHANTAGEEIITLGEDLTVSQKNEILAEFGVNEDEADIVYVTNEEEHHYLGDFIPASQIGSNAISSAKVTTGEKDTGLVVTTKNINFITADMYQNALATAGVEDAVINVTAPFAVSGTGALTGIIKGYEVKTGEVIDEDQKLVATEEMVLTSELADEGVDEEDVTEFFSTVKEEISKKNPKTDEEIREIIERIAKEFDISLSEERKEDLVNLFKKIKDLNIDWDKVNKTLKSAKEKVEEFASTEEGKGIIDSIINFFKSIFNWFEANFTK